MVMGAAWEVLPQEPATGKQNSQVETAGIAAPHRKDRHERQGRDVYLSVK